MYTSKLVANFKYCPFCTAELKQNTKFKRPGAKTCDTHGEFFIGRGAGNQPMVVFKKYDGRGRGAHWNAGRPHAQLKCDQTGELFKSQTEIVKKLGLPKGNLSAHIQGKPFARHVHGYTFSIVDVWDDED